MMILQQTRAALSSGGFDPIAARYLRTIESAGATISTTQRNAFSAFFRAGKRDGWFTQIGRLYLPIWGVAAPNAVDLITSTSGTFTGTGTVTHGAGFVQGNGSTGRFLMNASPQGVGMVAGSSSTFALVKAAQNGFNSLIVSTPSSSKGNGFNYGTNTTQYFAGRTNGFNTTGTFAGILIESEIAINSRYFRRRATAGVTSLAVSTESFSGNYAAFNQSVMAGQSVSGSFYGYSTAELGAYGIGIALTTTQADAFTLALKTLWETCTGLTLP